MTQKTLFSNVFQNCIWYFFLILSSFLFVTSAMAKNNITYDAIVNLNAEKGEFRTINEALSAAPSNVNKPYTIFIKNGIYHEKVILNRSHVTLIGENQEKTVIEYSLAAGMLDSKGAKVGTTGSAIFMIKKSNMTIEQLTIRNSFDFNANQSLPKEDVNRLKDTQAVAVLIDKNADQIRFKHVTIEGFQDTLYVKENSRSYFTDSTISGNVDFIFGDGTAIFDDCTIIARNRNDVSGIYGYITAPSTHKSQPYGLIFMNSKIIKEAGVPANSYALGRPWHPTTQFKDGRYASPEAIGMALFMNSQFDDHIAGWDKMSGKDIKGDVIYFYPKDSRFYEYGNKQEVKSRDNAAYLLSPEEAQQYTVDIILSDWPTNLLQK